MRHGGESGTTSLHAGIQAGGHAPGRRRELGVNVNLLGRWVKVLRTDPEQAFPGQGNLKDRDKEFDDLRRENTRLKGELSFLKKVSGYFAKNQR